MRRAITLLIATITLSCQKRESATETFPIMANSVENDWITYEGTMHLNEMVNSHLQLSLLAGSVGLEGSYELEEVIEYAGKEYAGGVLKGKYTTLYAADGEVQLHLHNSSHKDRNPIIFSKLNYPVDELILNKHFRTSDLVFKSKGEHRLVSLNPSHHEGNGFELIKRTSMVFTMEGYFTFLADSAEFFEMNTLENWRVAKHGAYHQAVHEYQRIAKEKYEGIYLKALAYTIQSPQNGSKPSSIIVLKRLISTEAPKISQQ